MGVFQPIDLDPITSNLVTRLLRVMMAACKEGRGGGSPL